MAHHSSQASMLRQSLTDMINGARICINYKKDDGGCLGYPACLILLSIADAIASYLEGDQNFKIKIDGSIKIIDSDGYKRFYIFNSSYYNLRLSESFIKLIYKNYRCLLSHNATLVYGHFINMNNPFKIPFDDSGYKNEETGEKYPVISLKPLLQCSIFAVTKFINNIDDILIGSKQAKIIENKRSRAIQ